MAMTRRWSEIRSRLVIFEDEDLLVLNKPAGLSVMGSPEEPDLVTLAREAGEDLKPAHRIDKVTTGAILLAKSAAAHAGLARQFAQRSLDKSYLAITGSYGLPPQGLIELPLTVGRKNRVRVAAQRRSIVRNERGDHWYVEPSDVSTKAKSYPSVTTFATVWADEDKSLLVVRPMTGRRHQIRVHLAWIGYPILGDPLFEKAAHGGSELSYLHAWRIAFDPVWSGGRRVELEAQPGQDFWTPLRGRVPPVSLLDRARRLEEELQRRFHSPATSGDGP